MMRRDPHAPGTVDRIVLRSMVGLDARTARPLYAASSVHPPGYRPGSRPALERIVRRWAPPGRPAPARVREVVRRLHRTASDAASAIEAMRFGGTEEAILARRSDWCTDVARVGCALFQVAGFPSRLVAVVESPRAYSGHMLVEVWTDGRWSAVDPTRGIVYRDAAGRGRSTWELLRSRADGHPAVSVRSFPFDRAAIAEYRIRPPTGRRYRVSRPTAYYRSILRESARGWPGGLRWLHGEDRARRSTGGRSRGVKYRGP